MLSAAAVITPITAGTANQVASAAVPRRYLAIVNLSTTATVYIAFDTAAVASPTAGQIVLMPATGANRYFWEWNDAFVPANAINIIASAAATPVTIIQ